MCLCQSFSYFHLASSAQRVPLRGPRINLTFRTVYPDPRGCTGDVRSWRGSHAETEQSFFHEDTSEAGLATLVAVWRDEVGICFSARSSIREAACSSCSKYVYCGNSNQNHILKSHIFFRQIKNCCGCVYQFCP